MGRPPIPYEVVRAALLELARGATIDQVAVAAAVSPRSVDRFVCEHGRMTTRATKQRPDALTFEDREEIRCGILRDESNPQIAERLGRDRSTIWREIDRNGGRDEYRAFRAHGACQRVCETAACDVGRDPCVAVEHCCWPHEER